MTRPTLDHVVLAGPDLDEMVERLANATGVRPSFGGVHEGIGTHNALLGLAERRYLELLAPVPGEADRSAFARAVADRTEPQLFMWAVRTPDLERYLDAGAQRGFGMGSVAEMSRTPPGAPPLRWSMSVGGADVYGSVVPFAIEWKTEGHPSDGLPDGCRMSELRGVHPEPDRIRAQLDALGVDLPIALAADPGLVLVIDSPRGAVELR